MPSTPPIDLADLDAAIHSPARLAVMALLVRGNEIDFTFLREHLALTDGNLATHLRKLEQQGYVRCRKSFVGRRPRTTYRITPRGRLALERHVAALERLMAAATTGDGRTRSK